MANAVNLRKRNAGRCEGRTMSTKISVDKISKSDVPELTEVMKKAFDDDTRRYLGKEAGGPEGYDNGEFFNKWLFGYEECEGYKILVDGSIVGGILVWIYKNDPDLKLQLEVRIWGFPQFDGANLPIRTLLYTKNSIKNLN